MRCLRRHRSGAVSWRKGISGQPAGEIMRELVIKRIKCIYDDYDYIMIQSNQYPTPEELDEFCRFAPDKLLLDLLSHLHCCVYR